MAAMKGVRDRRPTMPSRPAGRRQPAIRAGYEHFRLDREGALVSRTTLGFYDAHVLPFLTWLDGEGVSRFEHLDVTHARLYRARLATTPGRHGRPLRPNTLHGSHRAIATFLRWAAREGYPVDARILDEVAPKSVYLLSRQRLCTGRCLGLLARRGRNRR